MHSTFHASTEAPVSSSSGMMIPIEGSDVFIAERMIGDSETDTETSSSDFDLEPDLDPACLTMSQEQKEEHLWLTYRKARSNWRRLHNKPTRRVRRHLKRFRSGDGKGRSSRPRPNKGHGKKRFAGMAELSSPELNAVFSYFGSKGKTKGTGKGKGRRGNPIGCTIVDKFRTIAETIQLHGHRQRMYR